MEQKRDYYEVLELTRNATEEDIRAAVRYARIIIEREDVIPFDVVT